MFLDGKQKNLEFLRSPFFFFQTMKLLFIFLSPLYTLAVYTRELIYFFQSHIFLFLFHFFLEVYGIPLSFIHFFSFSFFSSLVPHPKLIRLQIPKATPNLMMSYVLNLLVKFLNSKKIIFFFSFHFLKIFGSANNNIFFSAQRG
jgi:hypothetical protein